MPEEKWEQMWETQREQQREFDMDPHEMTALSRKAAAKHLALGLYEEAAELARVSASFKAHILKVPPVEAVNVADECADVIKYTISIAQLFGVSADDLFEAFLRKTAVLRDRVRGERLELEQGTRVIVVDLDNCVSDLGPWQKKLDAARAGEPMNNAMLEVLEDLKSDFYRGGGFIDMPVIEGAAHGMRALHELGYKLVISTARPAWQYKRLYADTITWLADQGIVYDLILFNKDKAEAVYEHVFPARPTFFIEDRDKHALEIANIGVPVLLLDYPHNRSLLDNPLIKRVRSWQEIVEEAKLRLEAR